MKLTYRNTALGFLDNPEKIEFFLPPASKPMNPLEQLKFEKSVKDLFPKIAPMFKKKVRLVSMPFFDAYEKSKHKLADVFDQEEIDESGTLVVSKGSYTNTIFYYVKTYNHGDDWYYDVIYISFNKWNQSEHQHLNVLISEDRNYKKSYIWKGLTDAGGAEGDFTAFIIAFLVFIKHVELETKVIEGGRKAVHAGIKYKNETKQKVEILDSTYFTTIIRSGGFTVDGHFRKQPCGKERHDWKLIWISPFEKTGYTRKAKILSQ